MINFKGVSAVAVLAALLSPLPASAGGFGIAVSGPLGVRDIAMSRRLGMTVAAEPPSGWTAESAEAKGAMAPRRRLRWLAARAVARGAPGIFFRLPPLPEGREFADFPEEWQALARVARELSLAGPILEDGRETPPPFAPGPGIEAKCWTRAGRRYLLLVNAGPGPVSLDETRLSGWRALFEARSDARELLTACPGGRCLAAEQALWLEGRLAP
jgi:hypothetical protein